MGRSEASIHRPRLARLNPGHASPAVGRMSQGLL